MPTDKDRRTTGTHNEIERGAKEIKGATKQAIGGVTVDPELQDKGSQRKLVARLRKNLGRSKRPSANSERPTHSLDLKQPVRFALKTWLNLIFSPTKNPGLYASNKKFH